uniref:Putative cell cycle regulator n=1 Tax=viral metagenome TaxID=1070528 RepID=A0A6H1ZB20_9ZZZZ
MAWGTSHRWPEEEKLALIEYYNRKFTYRQIARKLGKEFTKDMVCGMVFRLRREGRLKDR